MIEQRELITVCRQIGSMMEAGVDILRITRVLRAQTDDPETLRAFDTIDHALRMGQSLSDAMENVPAMFSPFAVSLVRQGEARNDIAGAWHKIADFLQKEGEADIAHESSAAQAVNQSTPPVVAAPAPAQVPAWVIDDLVNRAQVAALRTLTLIAGLLLTLAAVWWSVEAGLIERRWQNVLLCSVSALFIGGAGVWLRRRIATDRKRELGKREIERREALEKAEAAPVSSGGSTPAPGSAVEARKVQGRSEEGQQTDQAAPLEKIPSPREATFD